jgi:gas vesicle protein
MNKRELTLFGVGFFVAAIICTLVALLLRERYGATETLAAMQRIEYANMVRLENNRKEMDAIMAQIEAERDTITIIEQKAVKNYNTYVQQVSNVVRNSNSEQFNLYRANTARFDSLFIKGRFFDRLPE